MNDADEVIVDVTDDCTDDDLEEMAMDHAITSTGFDYWFERLTDEK